MVILYGDGVSELSGVGVLTDIVVSASSASTSTPVYSAFSAVFLVTSPISATQVFSGEFSFVFSSCLMMDLGTSAILLILLEGTGRDAESQVLHPLNLSVTTLHS